MSKKILLADDSITIQKVIELTFSDEDFEVVTVGNGRLAIERVQDVRPDLVLCDIIMPEKDGYEVCDFIKKHPALSRTPVLLLTGAFEPFDQERAARVGCDGFLAKPFEPQTLIAKVKDLLARAVAAPAAPVTPPPAVAAAAAPPAAAPPAPSAAPPAPFVPAGPVWSRPAPAAASPSREPEPFAFVPEPPSAYEPPPSPPAAMPFEEAGVSFFTDETFEEIPDERPVAATPARSGETAPVTTFPETPDFEEYRSSTFDEMAPAAPTVALPAAPAAAAAGPGGAGQGGFPALDEDDGPQTLLHVSAEEMATLRGEPARPPAVTQAPPAPAVPAAAPPARAPLWTQQTMEVPLETRARVAMEAAHLETEPVFEEVFEPAPAAPPAPARPAAAAPAPAAASATRAPLPAPAPPKEPAAAARPPVAPRPEPPAPVPKSAPAPAAPAPAPAMPAPVAAAAATPPPVATVSSPLSARPGQDDPATLSVPASKDRSAVRSSVPSTASAEADAMGSAASGVNVPVDMVSQIAQRVVAQISEKVIREVAWEVIPDLAEVLIKKEIERLKAELQRT